MKRDWLHTGRRPSGLCGAALLIAARLHDFSRTPMDIIKIVKIHESTLRKRLFEFGETPSSSLTLDEFMTVDLEEEQDPPAFKAARKKDRDRLQKLIEEEDVDDKVSQLQKEIDKHIEERRNRTPAKKRKQTAEEEEDADSRKEKEDEKQFIVQSTLGTIQKYLRDGELTNQTDDEDDPPLINLEESTKKPLPEGLGPTIAIMGLEDRLNDSEYKKAVEREKNEDELDENEGELDLEGIDDEEIESYIVSEREALSKEDIWMKINAEYLKEQKEKEERLAKEREGKPEKKKRKVNRKPKSNYLANSAGEAIEKMLQEKKISSKINYDVLRSLTDMPLSMKQNTESVEGTENASPTVQDIPETVTLSESVTKTSSYSTSLKNYRIPKKTSKIETPTTKTEKVKPQSTPTKEEVVPKVRDETPSKRQDVAPQTEEQEEVEELEEEEEEEHDHDHGELSVAQLLSQHRGEDDEYYNEYDDDDYA